jgi:uncharacterized protein YprB with RNaseH-like and TPR domain/predicted nuclease with RNAse H fold/dephospho-CoA kinase
VESKRLQHENRENGFPQALIRVNFRPNVCGSGRLGGSGDLYSLFDRDAEEPTAIHGRGRTASSTRKASILDTSLPASLSAGRVLFLDVETTGLSWFYDEITIIGWAMDSAYKTMIHGEDPKPLLDDLAAAAVLVTFNGTLFDLRFLRKTFGEIELPGIHIDLRYLARRAGLTGGQKNIERELGIQFRDGLEDVDGAAAVLLWHEYLRGNDSSLISLIRYNRSDVLAMAEILDCVLDRLELQHDFWLRLPSFGPTARRVIEGPLPTLNRLPIADGRGFRTFMSTFQGTPAETARIVGIDLTGSEKRGSGWCLLNGTHAETLTTFTDGEMVGRILADRPDLVSIDSPLSLPYGRMWVTDNDPGRAQFGIMRECERELKRRGINVYPALLPSMQGLTRRGMLLASRLRAAGIPVIESYPGAAQDIMGIPRKGAGIEYLKRGLSEFGIMGQFVTTEVSHDELDAITSALVGSFFLARKYEALRGRTEGALIIPDLKAGNRNAMVIGISGRICAGKTTAARLLEKRGFAYTRFSMVIDDEIIGTGGIPDRKSRQRVGIEIHEEKGQRWLCEKVLDRVQDRKLIVIDGLRFPEDHAYFSERYGADYVHVHIVSSEPLRRARYDAGKDGDPSFLDADMQPVERKIDELKMMATAVIENDGSLDSFEGALMSAIKNTTRDGVCLFQSS